MAGSKTIFACTECGATAPKWLGRCEACGSWNTYVEEIAASTCRTHEIPHDDAIMAAPLSEYTSLVVSPVSTGIDEFDRVLGGGLVDGSVTLVGGEPGIGKSTLLAQVGVRRAMAGERVLYASAEESPTQVTARVHRLGSPPEGLWLSGSANLEQILDDIRRISPRLVVLDSIQTVFDPALNSAPGSVAQVRHCAHRVTRIAKEHGMAVVIVGQVTKDGGLAGPRVLEHLVDTVVTFEGDRDLGLRLLRASKHRFGPTGQVGVFEMTGAGLVQVDDPSRLLLTDRRGDVSGSVIAVAVEGFRPLVIEIQSLMAEASAAVPRRYTQGIDQARVAMLQAVLAKRAGVDPGHLDVYASVVGGIRLQDPGADLAVLVALASAASDRVVASDTVVIGEVGLAGEVRSVSGLERRLAEATRLGFRRAVVPASGVDDLTPPGRLEVIGAATVAMALSACDIGIDRGAGRLAAETTSGARPVLTVAG